MLSRAGARLLRLFASTPALPPPSPGCVASSSLSHAPFISCLFHCSAFASYSSVSPAISPRKACQEKKERARLLPALRAEQGLQSGFISEQGNRLRASRAGDVPGNNTGGGKEGDTWGADPQGSTSLSMGQDPARSPFGELPPPTSCFPPRSQLHEKLLTHQV